VIVHDLALIRARIIACESCPRLRAYCVQIGEVKRRAYLADDYSTRPVPGFGDPAARLLIVGLAPAAHGANRTGRVFTGDGAGGSGDFLMASLHRFGFANRSTSTHKDDGLELRDAYISMAVRCAPPGNKPTPEEIDQCSPYLEAEAAALPHTRVVVALGRIAFDTYVRLLERRGTWRGRRPRFGHGSRVELPGGVELIGCYHPSRQNTNTHKLTPGMMDDVFRLARGLIDRAG
jgi:uracil-DNA glycosylase family 4